MLKVAVLGGSGYTGLELLRLLHNHPEVEISAVTSRQYRGKAVSEVFPAFRGMYDGVVFRDPDVFKDTDADVVFSSLPHGTSMDVVPGFLDKGKRVVDLSADYRLRDIEIYERWYGRHSSGEYIKEAVYGLPELRREMIRSARLVANPGCYPTCSIIALAPVVSKDMVDIHSIVIDAKSGVSGAGRTASIETSFVEVTEGFRAYRVGTHRHIPEIEQELSLLCGACVNITFIPHLIPASRGILATVYAWLKKDMTTKDLMDLYMDYYREEPFVRIMPEGTFPATSQVRGSNFCDIGIWAEERGKRLVVVSAIDNLVKGASGQAIQNMNIMYGFKEDTGLDTPPMSV